MVERGAKKERDPVVDGEEEGRGQSPREKGR